MSWWDASESFFIDIVARDRIDDLRATIDVAATSGEAIAHTPSTIAKPRRAPGACGALPVIACRTPLTAR